jgi:hypothetical protein
MYRTGPYCQRRVLCCAVLCCAVLCCAVLCIVWAAAQCCLSGLSSSHSSCTKEPKDEGWLGVDAFLDFLG